MPGETSTKGFLFMQEISSLYDHSLEEGVLGAIMLEKEVMFKISDKFKPEYFHKPEHRIVAKAILELYKEKQDIDILTVTTRIRELRQHETVTAYFVSSLTNRIASSVNTDYHLTLVMQFFLKRTCFDIGKKLQSMSLEHQTDPFEIIEKGIKMLDEAQSGVISKQFDTIENMGDEFMKNLESKRQGVEPSGIFFDLKKVDEVTGGAHKTDLIIVAARPGMGKTSLAMKVLRNCGVNLKKPCGIFSLEMSSQQLLAKIAAGESSINYDKFRTGQLENHEMNLINSVIVRLKSAPIYIDSTGGINIYDLENRARKMKRDFGIELLIVDYLQLITCSEFTGDKTNQTTFISGRLKGLAKELNIPVIALSQLSRSVEARADKMPILSDLRDSGAIEQDADLIFFIMRPEYYKIDRIELEGNSTSSEGKALIELAKHRHGKTSLDVYGFSGAFSDFYDLTNF